jgi:hypothetical protein
MDRDGCAGGDPGVRAARMRPATELFALAICWCGSSRVQAQHVRLQPEGPHLLGGTWDQAGDPSLGSVQIVNARGYPIP